MRINNPSPAIRCEQRCNGPQDQSAALSLSVIISQYFIGGMTPEIRFHRFRDLAQGDTGTGDERFEQDVA